MHPNILICLYLRCVFLLAACLLMWARPGKNANWLTGLVTPKENNDFNGLK